MSHTKKCQNFDDSASISLIVHLHQIVNNIINKNKNYADQSWSTVVDGKFFEYLPEESATNSHKIVGLCKPSIIFLQNKKDNEHVFSQNIC